MRKRVVVLAIASMLVLLAWLVFARRSALQPGALLLAHQQLINDCTACHRPWRGPSNDGCVSCHGNIGQANPHSDYDVSESDTGLIAGHKLTVSANDELECLSCHDEHRGAVINIKRDAGFACTWCHEHPTIRAVTEHTVPEIQRRFSVRHLFEQPFDHQEHKLLDESRHSTSGSAFICTSCHIVVAAQPGKPERMTFRWSGCTGIGCHITPQDRFLKMPSSLGPAPTTIPYSADVQVRHINAVFAHSRGHLQSRCEQCHTKVAASRTPDDGDSLAISQCFDCHAHEANPGRQHTQEARDRGCVIQRNDVLPAAMPSAWQAIVACSDCHLFHVYGVVPSRDFEKRAPEFPPKHRPSHVGSIPAHRSSRLSQRLL
jgi:hypothetical protein